MQTQAPWKLVEETNEPNPEIDGIIYQCAESLRIVGILLQPYMPSKMKHFLDMLGVDDQARSFEHARRPDMDFGHPTVDIGKGLSGTLFPPLSFHN